MLTLVSIKNYIKAFLIQESFPKNPLGSSPRATPEKYIQLHNIAQGLVYPELDALEKNTGHSIDRKWVESLALHTQVVIKKAKLNYQHGRLLYVVLSRYLVDQEKLLSDGVTILETGTARGFSALCMARVLLDRDAPGKIVTLDILPHNKPMFWNCIDDHEGQKTRQQLLAPWFEELERIIFIQGWTKEQLQRTGLSRVHFAFLDAQHTKEDVMSEYAYVRARQCSGDVIVFDDVTPGLFDGVVEAVNLIESEGAYRLERLSVSGERGYAIAYRL